MSTISALRFDQYSFAPLDAVYLTTVPKPSLSNDTEILVKVKSAAINPADFAFIAGIYPVKADSFPAPVGFEASGIVEAVGKESGFKEGQRVHFVQRGSWAQYVIIDTKTTRVVPIPDELSFEEGTQLTINPLTATALLSELAPKRGEFLVQDAAASALGKIVIQLAKAQGIKTINIVRRDEHIEPLKKLGADYVINSEKDDVVQKVLEISPGGVKYALDCVAGKTGGELTKVLAEGGILICFGVLSGLTLDVNVPSLLTKGVIVRGFNLSKWTAARGIEKTKEHFGTIIKSILSKELILSYKTFDGLTQFKEGLKHAKTPGKDAKTLLLF